MALGDKKNVPWSVNGILADAGGDIRVAAASIPTAGGASIEASLSTKANIPQEITAAGDLNDYTIPGMYYCAWNSVAQQIQHMPPGLDNAFSLFVELGAGGQAVQTFKSAFNLHIYTRQKSHYDPVTGWVETWSGWERLATAKPPQEHPLPLAAGVSNSATGASRYSKDQLGRVLIHVGVKLSQMAGNHLIAALPSGYRPAEGGASAVFIDTSNSRAISSWILSDGNLWVYCPQEISSASGQIEFIATA